MITPDYCLTMARYNAWQNRQLREIFETLDRATLEEQRGAFFGSILGTANHLLWGDRIWMSRLGLGEAPGVGVGASTGLTGSGGAWAVERFRTDGRLLLWAEKLRSLDLVGNITWYSGAAERWMSKPRSVLIAHMFNHQTHHRGQIHAMLTAAGVAAPLTDLFLMPEDGPWL